MENSEKNPLNSDTFDKASNDKVFFALNNPDSIEDIFLKIEGKSLLNSMIFVHYKLNSSVQLINKLSNYYKDIHTVSIKNIHDLENFKEKSLDFKDNLVIIVEVVRKNLLQGLIDFMEEDSFKNNLWIISPIKLINQQHLSFFNLFFFFDMAQNDFQKLKNFTDIKELHIEAFSSVGEDENKVLFFLNERKSETPFFLENNPCLLDF